jgi:hypothetical protein
MISINATGQEIDPVFIGTVEISNDGGNGDLTSR